MRHFLLTLALLVLGATPAAAEWRKAESPHFIVYSEGSEGRLHRFATQLERFDALLRALSPSVPEAPSPVKLQVFMIESGDRLERLTGNRAIAGFYRATVAGPIAVALANTGTQEFTPEIILFHEYAHHFMFQNFTAAYPAWFVEGYAEFYATARIAADGTIQVGGIPEYRRYERDLDPLPLDRLLFTPPWELRGPQSATYYSQAWYLIHFLTFSREREGQLREYLTLLSAGQAAEAAAAEAFGDVGRFAAEFRSYRRRSTLDALEISFEQAPALPAIRIETLPEAEGELLWHRLRYLTQPSGGAARDLARDVRARAAAAPDDPAALQMLADAEHLAGNREAAAHAVDRLIALRPDAPRALLRKGLLEIDALDESDVTDEARWRAARRWIVRANHAAPDDPLVLYQYYVSFLRQGVAPPDAAANGLQRAFELVPQDSDVRVQLAQWMVGRRRHGEAMILLAPVAFSAHRSPATDAAIALVERIRGVSDGEEARPPAVPAEGEAEPAGTAAHL